MWSNTGVWAGAWSRISCLPVTCRDKRCKHRNTDLCLFNRRDGSFLHVQVGEALHQHSRELFFYCQMQITCGLVFLNDISKYNWKKGTHSTISAFLWAPKGSWFFNFFHLNGMSSVSLHSAQVVGLPSSPEHEVCTYCICVKWCIFLEERLSLFSVYCLLRLFMNLYHNLTGEGLWFNTKHYCKWNKYLLGVYSRTVKETRPVKKVCGLLQRWLNPVTNLLSE